MVTSASLLLFYCLPSLICYPQTLSLHNQGAIILVDRDPGLDIRFVGPLLLFPLLIKCNAVATCTGYPPSSASR